MQNLPSAIPRPETDAKGRRIFRVSYYAGGKQRCRKFRDVSEAYQFQKDVRVQFIQLGNAFEVLKPKERSIVMQILLEMEDFNTDILSVWEFFKKHNSKAVSVGELFPEFIDLKRSHKLRPSSIQSLETLNSLWDKLGRDTPVRLVRPTDIDQWAKSMGKAPRSYIKYISNASSFFSWAKRLGHVDFNPAKRLDLPKIDQKTPYVLSNEDVQKLLVESENKPILRCYLILSLFAGVRPNEIMRLKWSNIDLDNGTVTLDGNVTKTRSRRITHLLGNAAEALKKTNALHLCPKYPQSDLQRIATKAGVRLEKDCLRHTAASHMINVYRSMDEVAIQLGNTPGVLRKHYMGLMTQDKTEEFLKLL